MFIKLGGVRGSGKSTVSQHFVSILQNNGYNAEHVYGSKMMADILGVPVRELGQCSEADRKSARIQAYNELYARDLRTPGIRVRDGHFAIVSKTPAGLTVNQVDLLPQDRGQLRAIYVLNPPIETLLDRRHADFDHRNDRYLDSRTIATEQRLELAIASAQADELGVPFRILEDTLPPEEISRKLFDNFQEDIPLRDREPCLRQEGSKKEWL